METSTVARPAKPSHCLREPAKAQVNQDAESQLSSVNVLDARTTRGQGQWLTVWVEARLRDEESDYKLSFLDGPSISDSPHY